MRDLNLRTTNSPLSSFIERMKRKELDVDPPFQRGSVWGNERKQSLIRSITIGLPIGSIFIDERPYPEWPTVIDGKQRLLAVKEWMEGRLRVPAEWFEKDELGGTSAKYVTYIELSELGKRRWSNTALVQVYWSSFTGSRDVIEDQERKLFDLINFGGVPQGESDHDA